MDEPARDQLEPKAAQIADGEVAASVSQAISLKRIADAIVSFDLQQLGVQIENIAWRAGQSFEAGKGQKR